MRVKSEDVTLSFMYRYMYIYALSFFYARKYISFMKARAKIYSIPKLVYMYVKMYVHISYLDFKSVVSHCCLKFYKKVYSGD